MSEHIRPEWLQIPREDHQAMIAINGIARIFSTANTAIWLYPEEYSVFNNIIQEAEDGSYYQWFGIDEDDIDMLHEAGITTIYPPYPSDNVIKQFWAVEMAHYDQELVERQNEQG